MRILLAMGTRPEVIKMQSVYHALKESPLAEPIVCLTGQHMELCDPLMKFFQIKVDHSLNLMSKNQTLSSLASRVLGKLPLVLGDSTPDAVLVQGDTTTALSVAIASFHEKIPVGHIEAGLRTGRLDSPFPEEGNRCMISRIAKWHFAPTEMAAKVLRSENVSKDVHVTGNTVIDSLLKTKGKVSQDETDLLDLGLKPERYFLLTIHRRESFGAPLVRICEAINSLARSFPNYDFILPVHPNPNVRNVVTQKLNGLENIKLLDPLPYPEFVLLMSNCHLIITDSGGIQEEAPALGKPVVVLRDVTERTEVLEVPSIKLAGTDPTKIINSVKELLAIREPIRPNYIFGDGNAARRIVEILTRGLNDH